MEMINMSGKKKTNTPKKDRRQLEKWTDEELETFIRERRLREITPNMDKQIAIMVEVIDKLEKLSEYAFRESPFGSTPDGSVKVDNRLENGLLAHVRDYYNRLIREKTRYGEKK
jgi:hypothetical protein